MEILSEKKSQVYEQIFTEGKANFEKWKCWTVKFGIKDCGRGFLKLYGNKIIFKVFSVLVPHFTFLVMFLCISDILIGG